jgi:predicted HD phosphohydrolase
MLAEEDNCSPNLIVASLLHDIGHLLIFDVDAFTDLQALPRLGVSRHEDIGKHYLLSLGYNDTVANLVGNHVLAKRYLVSKDEQYYSKLSDASKETLGHQGGLMSRKELEEFEKDPLFLDSLKLRQYDDKAKVQNVKVKAPSEYVQLLKLSLKNSEP